MDVGVDHQRQVIDVAPGAVTGRHLDTRTGNMHPYSRDILALAAEYAAAYAEGAYHRQSGQRDRR